ncbi:hypothetical protein Hanom_Chr10g00964461 [Helianthus anomalus]
MGIDFDDLNRFRNKNECEASEGTRCAYVITNKDIFFYFLFIFFFFRKLRLVLSLLTFVLGLGICIIILLPIKTRFYLF